MSMTLERITPIEPLEPEPQAQPKKRLALMWQNISLGAILILSAFMGFYQLDINGYSNAYYAAAVKSMLTSWSNFFFVSLDPGGFVTVDKPPVAFWLQAISAKIFGFSGVSLLLPQVLAGIAGVALLYFMVKKAFGPVAATVAALVLTITPMFVVMNRDNNPDSILVFTLLVAAWAMLRAAETGRLRWLLFGSVMVGVAFNVKTLEAFIVLPAFYALYFFTAKAKWRTRIVHLILAGVLILAVSFSWSVAVDSIPASQRPYVGSSGTNSELNLIFGYNGLGRIDGSENGPGSVGNGPNGNGQPGQNNQGFPGGNGSTQSGSNQGFPGGNGQGFPGGNGSTQSANGQGFPGGQGFPSNGQGFPGGNGQGFPGGNGQGFPGGPNGGGGGNPLSAGNPGVTRLIVPDQAGQFNWFFPLAMIGLALAAYTTFRMKRGSERTRRWQGLIVWAGWFFLVGAVFSFAQGIFHTYYLVLMAPAEAALAGIAVAVLWEGFRRGNWQAWLLPIALGATAFYQAYILTAYTSWNKWLLPSLVVLGVVSFAVLVIAKLSKSDRFSSQWAKVAVGVTLAGLLVTPTTWSVMTLSESIQGAMPNASPSGSNDGGRGFGFGSNASTGDWLSFIKSNLSGQIFVIVGVIAVVGLVVILKRANVIRFNGLTLRRVTAVGLVALLIASSGWWYGTAQAQATTTNINNNGQGQQFGPGGDGQSVNSAVIQYLEANQDGYKYLVAVDSSMSADSIIISTSKPVMALGGFNGSDKILSLSQLQQLIKNHTVRYFMVGGAGGGPGGNTNNELSSWVTAQCTVVNTGTSASTTGNSNRGGFGGQQSTIYDCSKAV